MRIEKPLGILAVFLALQHIASVYFISQRDRHICRFFCIFETIRLTTSNGALGWLSIPDRPEARVYLDAGFSGSNAGFFISDGYNLKPT